MKQSPAPPSRLPPTGFQDATGISSALVDRFAVYAELLCKWQKKINLVSPATVPDLWRRHFLDSAQLFPLIPPGAGTLADLGSGAGFPGLVLALLISEKGGPDVRLIEANRRKAAFLEEVARETETTVVVEKRRIESLHDVKFEIVTARGCAPLERLLPLAVPILASGGICLFLKGQKVDQELTESQKTWKMQIERIPSQTSDSGVILKLKGLSQRHEL